MHKDLRRIATALERHGFVLARSGKHNVYKREQDGKMFILPQGGKVNTTSIRNITANAKKLGIFSTPTAHEEAPCLAMKQETITPREISERFGIPISTVRTVATKHPLNRAGIGTYVVDDRLLGWLERYKPQGGALKPQQERELRYFVARHREQNRMTHHGEAAPRGSITLGEIVSKGGDGSNEPVSIVAKPSVPETPAVTNENTPAPEPAPAPSDDVGELLLNGFADLQKRVSAIEALQLQGSVENIAGEVKRLRNALDDTAKRVAVLARRIEDKTPVSAESRWAVLKRIVDALDTTDLAPEQKEAIVAQILGS